MYATKTIEARATDGTVVKLTVPVDLPSEEEAEELRALYREHVKPINPAIPKGPAEATVPTGIAGKVAAAMEFHGDIVDETFEFLDGTTYLYSLGYYHHIGA